MILNVDKIDDLSINIHQILNINVLQMDKFACVSPLNDHIHNQHKCLEMQQQIYEVPLLMI